MSEVWVDHDYPARKRVYEKCKQCGDDLLLRHICTDDDLRFVLKFPDKCCAEVSRSGQSQPCDKPAVAVAYGDTDGWRCGSDSWWPVCPHHARARRMVPLADLIARLT